MNQVFRFVLEEVPGRARSNSTWIISVTIVDFVIEFVSRKLNAFSINNDNKIAGICIRSKNHLVLTAQNSCDLASHAAQDLPIRIDDVPFSLCKRFFSIHYCYPHKYVCATRTKWRGRRES